ncbi:MAG: hypothetical protein R6W82_03245 [bacterium]
MRENRGFPWYGTAGLLLMAGGIGAVLGTGWWFPHVYFTPLMWTGYLLAADALLFRREGVSWLRPLPGRFLFLLPVSLLFWLLFEAYNLHLRNWTYVGLPESLPLKLLGYGWSFATIWPALFLTADLLESFGLRREGPPLRVTPRLKRWWLASGLLLALVPLLLPSFLAAYTFAIVWVAYVPLVEPLLHGQEDVPSLLGDLGRGDRTRWWSLGTGGIVCGLLWESWNMLAAARWIYIFPLFQDVKLFEMPLPGFLGFIPFAWEAWSLYALALWALNRMTRRSFGGVSGPPPLPSRRG